VLSKKQNTQEKKETSAVGLENMDQMGISLLTNNGIRTKKLHTFPSLAF
jgi:hypothetical protein